MEVNYDERKLTELLVYVAERLLSDTWRRDEADRC